MPALLPPPADLLVDASLFLDFDGTLVEIVERPDAVQVDARLARLIRTLDEALGGRVALISGRSATRLRALVGSDIAIVGSHGMEFMARDGTVAPSEKPAALREIEAEMFALAGAHPGVLIEVKPLGVALHYRSLPAAEAACRELAASLAERHRLHLQDGKMMIEVRAAGGDKGTALQALMREPDRASTRPVFIGDDVTDEPGFAAAGTLGGVGILVGEGRSTAAHYRLNGVEETLAWLEAAAAKAG